MSDVMIGTTCLGCEQGPVVFRLKNEAEIAILAPDTNELEYMLAYRGKVARVKRLTMSG